MHQLIRFPADRILREQIVLIRENDPVCLLGVIAAAAINSYIIFSETTSQQIFYWLGALIVLTIVWALAQRRFPPQPDKSARKEASIRVAMVIVYSVIWSWMILTYLPQATPLMLVTITMITGAVAAGSVATQSPCLPLCMGFVCPSLISIVIGLAMRGHAIDYTLAIGATLYFSALVLCMMTMERTMRNSIELSFDKQELIDQLHSSLEETEEANAAKSRFLASASHDLRQPIQAMSLVTEAMKGTLLNDYQQKLHGHLQAAVESTYSMLDSLLDFSKVDAGAVTPKIEPFAVDTLLHHLETELAPLADRKQLSFRCRSTKAVAESDPRIVEMILRNLITNAIRYTRSGGILLSCRKRNKELSLEVWDTGIGMNASDKALIFKEFRQLKNPKSDGKKGFGLGLAISQGLARVIDSEITVESRLDRGSVFRFSVPSSQDTVIVDTPDTAEPIQDFHGKSVLVIDDNERIRVSMKTLLESWGCHCIACDSTDKALQHIARRQPDIMLVDYRLGAGKTGSHAINSIRTFLGRDIPAVIITGDSAKDRLSEVTGPVPAFMRKPASAVKLRQMINSLL